MPIPTMKAASISLFLFLACCLLPNGTRSAHADYYKYTDKTGAICITNTPDSVPPKYRATMKVIREATLDKKDRASRIETPRGDAPAPEPPRAVEELNQAPDEPAAPTSTFGRLSARFPWFKPLLVICAFLGAFLAVQKLASILPSALLVRLIYLVFFLAAFVFVYKSYADHLSNSYCTVKTKILTLFKKSNSREAPDTEPGERPLPATGRDQSSL